MKSFLIVKIRTIWLLILLLLAAQCNTPAQDKNRFLKVSGWKVHYEIIREGIMVYPETDTQTMEKLQKLIKEFNETNMHVRTDMSTVYPVLLLEYVLGKSGGSLNFNQYGYTIGVLNTKLIGDCVLSKNDEPDTWVGSGTIRYSVNEISMGEMMGSKAYGLLTGQGETRLFEDESYVSFNPSSGTYELVLLPGSKKKSGITLQSYSQNTVWTDVLRGIKEQLGESVTDAAIDNMPEIMESIIMTEEDAYLGSNPEIWQVMMEERSLPETGLVISGEEEFPVGYRLIWKIEPN